MSKPKIAVYKFSSCDGCQLSILNLEDELLDLADVVDIAYFLEARSEIKPGPYDIALVEGSVSTPHEKERIEEIRNNAHYLIALGTCATSGGIQALRNFSNAFDYAQIVYPHPEYLSFLEKSTPIAEHVKVDLEVWGCPVNKYQVLEIIIALLRRKRPGLPNYSVCLDCKRKGIVCVMVNGDQLCLGPVTRSGCGAICPSNGRGCYGCFGPAPAAELDALIPILTEAEKFKGEAGLLLRHISANAPKFRDASNKLLAKEQ